MIHYHGTPITPRSVLEQLAGRHFCVSYAAPHQVEVCHKIGQSVMLDNGAYSVWRQGLAVDWDKWVEWAEPWLQYPTTWAVLPDSIEGAEEDNDRLLAEYAWLTAGYSTFPVWHLHESFTRLLRLAYTYGRVCFGSSGAYATIGNGPWRRRVTDAFDTLDDELGRLPWVHMLRGMSMSGDEFPFASVDSTDIARNHNRDHNSARQMAERWDSLQCPGTWVTHRQLPIENVA